MLAVHGLPAWVQVGWHFLQRFGYLVRQVRQQAARARVTTGAERFRSDAGERHYRNAVADAFAFV